MNSFQDTPITILATGHTFLHRSYCASPKEAADFARLTFTNPAVFAVGQAGDAAVAALEYSEGWNQSNPEKKPGWTLQNLNPTFQTATTETTETEATVQTELF